MRVVLHCDDGSERDITEHFRLLYDLVVGSMDWGSGFLDLKESLQVLQIGAVTGWTNAAEIASVAKLDGEYPEAEPVRVPYYLKNPPVPRELNDAWREEWAQYNTRQKEWVTAEAARRYGDPPTWETVQALLDKADRKYDSVDGETTP